MLLFLSTQSVACPFLIDPSSRATEWLRTHLKEQRLEVINQQVKEICEYIYNVSFFPPWV